MFKFELSVLILEREKQKEMTNRLLYKGGQILISCQWRRIIRCSLRCIKNPESRAGMELRRLQL